MGGLTLDLVFLRSIEQPGQMQVYYILPIAHITCHRLFADQQYDLG